MSSDESRAAPVPTKRRPQKVVSLLHGGAVHPSWNFANKRESRFFVVNLERVLSQIPDVNVTQTASYFAEAASVIEDETAWNTEQPFSYTCSHTQISRDNMRLPKTFGRAATILVAMELIAAEKAPHVCVYDALRILAADQFPDHFDQARLRELESFHNGMPITEKERLFGFHAQKNFEEVCLAHIEQSRTGLLDKLASGGCVTRYTADKFCHFVNDHYPAHLHIGPILSAGQNSHGFRLGEGPTVEGLHVPRDIDPIGFAPWS